MAFTELKLVKNMTNAQPNNKSTVDMTPVEGKDVVIERFKASVGVDLLTNACIVWDEGGPSEKILWSINGNDDMKSKIVIGAAGVDGVKKLTLALTNGSNTDNVFMSAVVAVRQR